MRTKLPCENLLIETGNVKLALEGPVHLKTSTVLQNKGI